MAPREANNPFADQYLTVEFDATAMMLPHDTGPAPMENNDVDVGLNVNLGAPMNVDMDVDDPLPNTPAPNGNAQQGAHTGINITPNPPTELLFQTPQGQAPPSPGVLPASLTDDSNAPEITIPDLNVNGNRPIARRRNARNVLSSGNETIQDLDPLAIDVSDPNEEEAWDLIEAAIASASENCVVTRVPRTYPNSPSPIPASSTLPQFPSPSSDSSPGMPRRRATSESTPASARARGTAVTPIPGEILPFPPHTRVRRHNRTRSQLSYGSVLDQDPSMSCSDDEQDSVSGSEAVPGMNATLDTSVSTLDNNDLSSGPGTPRTNGGLSFSPVRRLFRGEHNIFQSPPPNGNSNFDGDNVNLVTDEDYSSAGSSFNTPSAALLSSNLNRLGSTGLPLPPAPHRLVSGSSVRSSSTSSGRSIHWNSAFDANSANFDGSSAASSSLFNSTASLENSESPSPSPDRTSQINLSFGPNTTVADLKYFSERGCIVPLLRALHSPHLKTLGTRMLADYAKMPHRRVAVASNSRILEFCCRTMLEMPTLNSSEMGTDWPAREYAVETIRSLTATEDSDKFLMSCNGLLKALAVVARGGPFASYEFVANGTCQMTPNMGLVSGKARLHACIAIMNLSCGKANKIKIASITEVLEAMRDVMMAKPENFSPPTSAPILNGSSTHATPKSVSEEARLKATTCIKNLSNADRNDAALLGAEGLIEALAHVASKTCSGPKGATSCTTNACLALMNLSISKANKHKVFNTEGVMDSLMTVLKKTSSMQGRRSSSSNSEARIKACSALSNLAIGYENKIPMFKYPGFVKSILSVIETDFGEARTKACSILWSFAAEMKNQVPVVERGDILPALVRVAEEDNSNEARFKCVAALTLLAESLDNAMPLLESGALHPLMDILNDAGADPTQWKGQTASWCVGFLMNMSQSDEAAPYLREAGVVELLAPLLTLEHYQSLKAAMAVTFVCRYDEDDETYELLRQTENVIPKIIGLLHNTLAGAGGNGYKYGVFTLRSSVGCISSLASGPEFMKERISTKAVFDSLLQVVNDFCVNSGTNGAIVGGGRDDAHSATLAIRALQSLTEYLIPIPGSSSLPFGPAIDASLMTALESFGACAHPKIMEKTRDLAKDAFNRIQSSLDLNSCPEDSDSASEGYPRRGINTHNIIENSIVASLVQGCCIGPSLHADFEDGFFPSMIRTPLQPEAPLDGGIVSNDENMSHSSASTNSVGAVRTFLLTDSRTGRRFCVPTDPSGGRAFNDGRLWCYRRGRFCRQGEVPDQNYQWTEDLQEAYASALKAPEEGSPSPSQSSLSSTPGIGL